MSDKEFDPNSPAVTTTLNCAAGIINRLAGNSNVCKTLSITLAAAIIGFATVPAWWRYLMVMAAVIVLMLLDSLFIGLKKRTELKTKKIIESSKTGYQNPYDIFYQSDPDDNNFSAIIRGLRSSAVWPFYLVIILCLITGMCIECHLCLCIK
ncbi:MAG: hypothetical protein K2K37_11220 [Muribaculaceae bacterium]|nr:hypothetical protein [Muribaculaceae bacterium]